MTTSSALQSPDQLFGELFRDVQLGHVFADSKTFVDCVPKLAPAAILARYETEKIKADFDLSDFVHDTFWVPEKVAGNYVSDTSVSTIEHVNLLWEHLSRPADPPSAEGSSRVPLPYPYVVPGGRFREIFYWDSYFTMLGLERAGRVDLIRGMVDNFAYLIDTVGFIPNGNRTYFLSRSQPPYFALMVKLLADIDGPETLVRYKPQLQQEYDFWMQGSQTLTQEQPMTKRVVRVPGYSVVNRYWDTCQTPRPEAYRQEVELAGDSEPLGIVPTELFSGL